jgi:Uma2 family endonuclease
MTVTVSVPHGFGRVWTIDDLSGTPDDGNRYEIADGSLLVSPPPSIPHLKVNSRLRRMLDRQSPSSLFVIDCAAGIDIRRRTTCYIPDVMIVNASALATAKDVFHSADVLLVAEVLSPGNAGKDLVQKRHDYAAAGIPRYWIVDPREQAITVLASPTARPATTRRLWSARASRGLPTGPTS